LQAGATVKNDHHILAQRPGLLFLTLPEAFTRCHHENNRYDPPSNAKHRKERAQLMRPQGAKHIANKIAEDHSGFLDAPVRGT
jgi:hypothetical protein